MKIAKLKFELYDIICSNLSFEEKFNFIDKWFSSHVLQLGVTSVVSLDVLGRAKHEMMYMQYHRSNIIHKIAEGLVENKLVTETKLLDNYPDNKWGAYEQRTESKLWVLK